MKICRLGPVGQEIPAIFHSDGTFRNVSSIITDFSGENLHPKKLKSLSKANICKLPILNYDLRYGPPITGTGKFICVGLNYSDHAKETNAEVPKEPVLFMKATSTIMGCNDDIILPRGSTKSDWEVELGVVIGKTAKYVTEKDALEHVAGYMVINDLSERHFQIEREGQWVKGKSCDTFGPIGPWLVTPDEISDPSNLAMDLSVNYKQFQNGSTSTMVFNVAHIVSYISQFMSLQPGDIISTGTPPGVGLGQKPPVFLKVGDRVSLGIEGLGRQMQTVVKSN